MRSKAVVVIKTNIRDEVNALGKFGLKFDVGSFVSGAGVRRGWYWKEGDRV